MARKGGLQDTMRKERLITASLTDIGFRNPLIIMPLALLHAAAATCWPLPRVGRVRRENTALVRYHSFVYGYSTNRRPTVLVVSHVAVAPHS